MNNPQKIIECKTVFKSFSTKNGITNAVNGVNLSINKGECYGLVGESGCGKSTLSSLICALQKPDSGEILFEGKPVKDEKTFRRHCQIIFQDPYSSLNPKKKSKSIIE